tara:strand:+ start:453 stop:665 length:213 start_codon:yes stop_codon:yes gene_type:complete
MKLKKQEIKFLLRFHTRESERNEEYRKEWLRHGDTNRALNSLMKKSQHDARIKILKKLKKRRKTAEKAQK